MQLVINKLTEQPLFFFKKLETKRIASPLKFAEIYKNLWFRRTNQ